MKNGIYERVLTDARALIGDQKAWTRNKWASNEVGHHVPWMGADAVCFCMEGAILRASRTNYVSIENALPVISDEVFDFLVRAAREAGLYPSYFAAGQLDDAILARFNDDPKTTHEDVLQVLDIGIRKAALLGA